ncbi:hypothetical protein FB45DRAFT_895015 [Roridomyces roridus]|uniref:Cation/H+ exchanger transmembrane domain-containing protein n=1 Tax=Roridomyces roridus TaxID=1738132 RepID=A0AAD7CGJ8_9AGAR|nr:hypothetical protein FB45DRAFT_895015 [Roridomyces roridus]
MPFDAFNTSEFGITPWRLVLLLIVVLVLRRIPSVLLLYRWVPEIATWQEALFTGHFGPMGVGAVFVSTLARTRLPNPNNPPANQQELLAATIQPIVAFIVLGSIVVHGLSIPFFSLSGSVSSHTRVLMAEWLMKLRWVPVLPRRLLGLGRARMHGTDVFSMANAGRVDEEGSLGLSSDEGNALDGGHGGEVVAAQ